VEDPERICEECEKHSSSCKWPKTKAWSVCAQCTEKHIKCEIDGVPVSNRTLRRVGSSTQQEVMVDDARSTGDRQ